MFQKQNSGIGKFQQNIPIKWDAAPQYYYDALMSFVCVSEQNVDSKEPFTACCLFNSWPFLQTEQHGKSFYLALISFRFVLLTERSS